MNAPATTTRIHFEATSPVARALCSIIKLQVPIAVSVECCINTPCHSGAFHLSSHGETLAFLTLVSGEESPEINISAKSFSLRITPAHPDYDLLLLHMRLILKEAGEGRGAFSVGLN